MDMAEMRKNVWPLELWASNCMCRIVTVWILCLFFPCSMNAGPVLSSQVFHNLPSDLLWIINH